MKRIIVFTLLLSSFILHAQDPYEYGSFVIQGKAKGYTDPTLDFSMTGFFRNVSNSVVVKPDGTFRQRFPIQGRQTIVFRLGDDAIPYTVYAGDTLIISWDAGAGKKTFGIAGKNRTRTRELAIDQALYWQATQPLWQRVRGMHDSGAAPDPAQLRKLFNEFFNREVQVILDAAGSTITPHTNYLLTGTYFGYLRHLEGLDRTSAGPTLPLLQLDQKKKYPVFWIADTVNKPALTRTLREDWWLNVPEYRDYLYDYVRFGVPQGGMLFGTPKILTQDIIISKTDEFGKAVAAALAQGKVPELFALQGVQHGNDYLTIPNVREWFNTKVVMDGFGWYSFEETEQAYQSLISKLTSAYLRDTLQHFYEAKLRLKPGRPAPAFTLKNENNQPVSLADFLGKVVYIDFWGVGCGPCIYEIKNHVPQLQQQFEGKDVVFINICVDATGKEWTDALRKYNLKGINLVAEGWTDHPVCKDYNVNGIPHNVLIDKKGNISDNNAPRASTLLQRPDEHVIEKLLK